MLLIKFQNFEVQTMAKEEKLCKHKDYQIFFFVAKSKMIWKKNLIKNLSVLFLLDKIYANKQLTIFKS